MSFNVDKQPSSTPQYGNYENFQIGNTEAVNTGFFVEQDTLKKAQDKKDLLSQQILSNRPTLVSPGKDFQLRDLQSLLEGVKIKETNQNDENPLPVSQSEQENVYIDSFHDAVTAYAQANNLSQQDVAKLQFAYYNPGAYPPGAKLENGDSLDSTLSDIQGNAQQMALSEGVSPSVFSSSVKNAGYNLNISDSYNIAFKKAIEGSNLSPKEKATLVFMHFNPGTPIPGGDGKLAAKLKSLQEGALKQISQQYGVPPGWTPQLNSSIYNGVLNDNFQVNLQVEYNKTASGLSEVEGEQLKNAIQDINDPTTPPKIKELAQKTINNASAKTKTQNNLPSTWQPDPGQVSSTFDDVASNPAKAAYVQVNEMMNSVSNELILIVPESVDQSVTMDMLTSITVAIINAQNAVYDLQRSQSEVSKDESIARKEMVDQQVRERQDELNKVHKESKKQKKMHKVMKTLEPIMKAMTIASTAVFPLGLAFYFLDQKFHLTDQMIKGISKGVSEAIDKMIPANGNKSLERFKEGLKAVAEIAAFATILFTGPAFFLVMLGPMQLQSILSSMITEGSWVQNFCKMCGVPNKDIQWVVLGVNMSFTVACAVAALFVPGAEAEGAGEMAEAVGVASEKAAEITEEAAKATEAVAQQTELAVTIASNTSRGAEAADAAASSAEATAAATKATTSAMRTSQEAVTTVQRMIQNVIQKIKDGKLLDQMIQLLENVLKSDKGITLMNRLSQGMAVANLANSGLQTTNSTLQGFINLSQKRLADAKGKYESTIALLESMIKNLQKILNSLLDGMSDNTDSLTQLSDLHTNILNTLSGTLNEVTSPKG